MFCQNCGFKNPNGAIRCGRCGQALASPRQMQLNSQGSGQQPRAPRQQGSYPRPSSNARGYNRPSPGGMDYDRRYQEKRRSSGAGKILLTILLVLILLAGAGFAVWYFVLRKPAADIPQNPEIVVEDGSSQTTAGTEAQNAQNSQPQASVETLPSEGQGTASTVQEPASSSQTADGQVHAFSSPVALFETDSYAMTANGYTAYGSNGYGLQVTFTNKTGSDVYFGFSQPALNDVVTNVQKAYRGTAGSSQTAVFQLGNAAEGAASVKKISLPLVVYKADGNEYSIPSDMIENGNYELATTPVITLN